MEQPKYDRIAATFHWLTAALVITLIVLGIGGEAVGTLFGMNGLETIFLHTSLGLTVFGADRAAAAVAAHATSRRRFPRPRPHGNAARAETAHRAFYGFLLVHAGARVPAEFGQPLPAAVVRRRAAQGRRIQGRLRHRRPLACGRAG